MLGNLRKNKKGYVGIQLTSTQIRMVELSGTADFPIVEHFIVREIPPDIYNGSDVQDQQRLGDAIRKAFEKGGFTKKGVAIALPSNLVITREFTLPAGQEADHWDMVESEVQQTVPMNIDEIYIDYTILGPHENPDLVYAAYAVSKKQHVDEYIGALEIAGLVAKIVDTDHDATLHAIIDIAKHQKEGCLNENILNVSIGLDKTEYMAFRNEKMLWSREHHVCARTLLEAIVDMFGVEPEEALAVIRNPAGYVNKYPNVITDFVQPFVDSLALEVLRHIEMFNEESTSFGIQHIWLSGEGSHLTGLDETISARTGLKSQECNPLAHCKLGSKINSEDLVDVAPLLMVATGMALRTFE